MKPQRYAVVMAGGRGTRFWPLSRAHRPKQSLRLWGRKSLARATVDRILPFFGRDRILVVTVAENAPAVRRELPFLPARNFLVEPEGKNTAPCLGLAALEIAGRDDDAVMVALPADHWIGRRPLFESALKGAIAMAESRDDLVTIGVEPSRPDAGYGYILTGNRIAGVGSAKAYRVKGFIEKPTPRRASLLIRRQALWNSGIFAWRASVFLATLDRFSPTIRRPLARIERAAGGRSLARAKGRLDSAIRNEYRRMPDLSVDYAVLEAAAAEGRVLVIKGAFQWSDVGTWAAVYAILPRDRDGNAGRGKRLALDTRDCLVHSPGKLVALLGVHGIAIVDTSDAILIADLRRAQEVRDLARRLDRRSDLRRYR